jgi:3'-5' exonuclease
MKRLVIDIETVPLPGIMNTWFPQWAGEKNPDKTPEELEHLAGLYPEFGMVCCVCLKEYNTDHMAFSRAALAEEEKAMLYDLGSWLDQLGVQLIGHNIKGFDIPFLAKRYVAQNLPIPNSLKVAGKKPWEVPHQDTMELMKFGGYAPMSLRSACLLMGLKDPKEKECGKDVWDLFKAGDKDRLVKYCSGDVWAAEAVLKRLESLGGV